MRNFIKRGCELCGPAVGKGLYLVRMTGERGQIWLLNSDKRAISISGGVIQQSINQSITRRLSGEFEKSSQSRPIFDGRQYEVALAEIQISPLKYVYCMQREKQNLG